MKRIAWYSIILLVLAGGVFWVVKNPGTLSRRLSKEAFAYPDTASIGRIFMADAGSRQLLVERQPDGIWMVNNKFRARQDAIETLLSTIAQVEAKFPVNEAQYDLAVREIAGNHVKVEIYRRDGKRVRTYYVGPPTVRNRGNYMKLESSKDPYVVHIPGLDGFLQTRYVVDEADWRDRSIFRAKPTRIASLSIHYATNPDSSWTLTRTAENTFKLDSQIDPAGRPVNNRAALAYLQHYGNIHAESFMNSWAKKDSVLNSPPICTMVLNEDGDRTTEVQLFFRPINRRSKTQFDPFGNPLDYERDKYYAALNGGADLVLVQDFVFGKLFIGPSYFYQPEPDRASPAIR